VLLVNLELNFWAHAKPAGILQRIEVSWLRQREIILHPNNMTKLRLNSINQSVDEVSLALTTDSWSQTYRSRALDLSANRNQWKFEMV
jgi:hypothetical protein